MKKTRVALIGCGTIGRYHLNHFKMMDDVDVVGVNNRHLGTFVTDVATSFSMAPMLRSRVGDSHPFISESGISDPMTVRRLREEGFRGFLMGENFMKRSSPGSALAEFIDAL